MTVRTATVEKIEERIETLTIQQERIVTLLEQLERELTELRISIQRPREPVVQEPRETVTATVVQGSPRSVETNSTVSVGDHVRIVNPRPGQPSEGVVVRKTALFIFVEGEDGQIIRRSRRNIHLSRE